MGNAAASLLWSRRQLGFLVLASLLGGALVLRSTSVGIGVSPDSVAYLSAAKNIVAGHGIVDRGEPLVHYPPGYPVLVAATSGLTASSVLSGARILAVMLAAANIFLFGLVVWTATRSRGATFAVVLFLIASSTFLSVHVMAWSESTFLCLVFVGLLMLSRYLTGERASALWAASIAFGAAILTRHVGVMLVFVVAFAVLRVDTAPFATRLRRGGVALLLTLAPFSLWVVRNSIVVSRPSDWSFAWHPVDGEHLRMFVSTVSRFLVNTDSTPGIQAGITAMWATLIVFGFVSLRTTRDGRDPSSIMIRLLACFTAAYVAFVLFSISTYSAETPLDDRILLPSLVAAWALSGALATVAMHRWKNAGLGIVFCAILVAFTVIDGRATWKKTSTLHRNGIGFTSVEWRKSEIIRLLRISKLSRQTVYANAEDPVWLLAGVAALPLPSKVSPHTLRAEPDFVRGLQRVCAEVVSGNALIVYFDQIKWAWYEASADELRKACPAVVETRVNDGTVFGSVITQSPDLN